MYSVPDVYLLKTIFNLCKINSNWRISNLYQFTILGSLFVGTTGSITGTGILKISKISKLFMLSNKSTRILNCGTSKSLI